MKVRILHFARLRETLSIDEETIELPEGTTVETLSGILKNRHQILRRLRSLAAINEEYASPNKGVEGGGCDSPLPTCKRWLI